MAEAINKVNRAHNKLVQALGREPYPEEIAQELDLPVEKVKSIMTVAKRPVSLDKPVGDEDGDTTLSDFIEDDNMISPEKIAERTLLRKQVEAVLSTLTKRERRVIKLRFGIGDQLLVPSKKWVIFSILHVSASDRLRKRQKKNYAITAGQTFLKSIWIPLRSSIDNILVPRKNKLSRPSLWRILVIVKPEIKTEITRINYKACFS